MPETKKCSECQIEFEPGINKTLCNSCYYKSFDNHMDQVHYGSYDGPPQGGECYYIEGLECISPEEPCFNCSNFPVEED